MKVYNSTFETMLRLLCLLSSVEQAMSSNRILLTDCIATHGKAFHISEKNLNGDDSTTASELAAHRIRIQKTLKKMVQLGYVIPEQNNIFLYQISSTGKQYAQTLTSTYAKAYSVATKNAYQKYSEYSDAQLLGLICGNEGGTAQ